METKALENVTNENEPYVGLSAREEADLERLLSDKGLTIENAKALTEQLSKEVSSLDYVNIQDVMASEKRVEAVIEDLQSAIDETKTLEEKLDHYQSYLRNVRDIVLQVQEKETLYQIENENRRKLLGELESLISSLQFPADQEVYLQKGDISTEKGIRIALAAANTLSDCLNANIHPALQYLNAVKEQQNKLGVVQSKFANRLSSHINNVYHHALKEYENNSLNDINPRDLLLPSHQTIHNILLPFSPLSKWLKVNCYLIHKDLGEAYMNAVSRIYQKEILMYFEAVREKLTGGRSTLSSNDSNEGKRKHFNVVGFDNTRLSSSYGATNLQDMTDSISRSSELSFTEWEEFDSCFEKMLNAIDPFCLAEQQFCITFFDIDSHVPFTGHHRRNSSWSSQSHSISVSPSPSNPSQSSGEIIEPKKSETLRLLMAGIFSILESEFLKFVSFYDRQDGLYSMYLLARLTQHVLSTQDTGSFLAKTYGTILIQVKRNFDKFMQAQKSAIEDAKVPKKAKCGVLTFIRGFEQFAKQAESVFKGVSARRTDIDRWYVTLIRTMFDAIDKLSIDHHKTPSEIIRLENYHYLHNVLCTLKIQCLEGEKKEAKQRYNEALKDYVSRYFGRPLEKLNTFFEGVQMKVNQGVKAEEVGYQLAYSKQELRKVIKDCSLKEVRKGLEEMYKKVEKHVCEPDSTLIQVIWRSMQEEFISQYKSLQEMIEKCYPDANITLSFTIEDILQVFSDIAQSH
ncbi:exocyst complex component 1 [Tetranychus urticae]|uniref:Uncharacterized protein n=1 Tax=Tetranychus urticae TaxID=32264 RepID=T1KRN9_TETUR|nr:exocyst complex component 1 [Tetranychus urticae]